MLYLPLKRRLDQFEEGLKRRIDNVRNLNLKDVAFYFNRGVDRVTKTIDDMIERPDRMIEGLERDRA